MADTDTTYYLSYRDKHISYTAQTPHLYQKLRRPKLKKVKNPELKIMT